MQLILAILAILLYAAVFAVGFIVAGIVELVKYIKKRKEESRKAAEQKAKKITVLKQKDIRIIIHRQYQLPLNRYRQETLYFRAKTHQIYNTLLSMIRAPRLIRISILILVMTKRISLTWSLLK